METTETQEKTKVELPEWQQGFLAAKPKPVETVTEPAVETTTQTTQTEQPAAEVTTNATTTVETPVVKKSISEALSSTPTEEDVKFQEVRSKVLNELQPDLELVKNIKSNPALLFIAEQAKNPNFDWKVFASKQVDYTNAPLSELYRQKLINNNVSGLTPNEIEIKVSQFNLEHEPKEHETEDEKTLREITQKELRAQLLAELPKNEGVEQYITKQMEVAAKERERFDKLHQNFVATIERAEKQIVGVDLGYGAVIDESVAKRICELTKIGDDRYINPETKEYDINKEMEEVAKAILFDTYIPQLIEQNKKLIEEAKIRAASEAIEKRTNASQDSTTVVTTEGNQLTDEQKKHRQEIFFAYQGEKNRAERERILKENGLL